MDFGGNAGAGGGDERQHGLFALPTAGHQGRNQDERYGSNGRLLLTPKFLQNS